MDLIDKLVYAIPVYTISFFYSINTLNTSLGLIIEPHQHLVLINIASVARKPAQQKVVCHSLYVSIKILCNEISASHGGHDVGSYSFYHSELCEQIYGHDQCALIMVKRTDRVLR